MKLKKTKTHYILSLTPKELDLLATSLFEFSYLFSTIAFKDCISFQRKFSKQLGKIK